MSNLPMHEGKALIAGIGGEGGYGVPTTWGEKKGCHALVGTMKGVGGGGGG
jgi:hypothetical protein